MELDPKQLESDSEMKEAKDVVQISKDLYETLVKAFNKKAPGAAEVANSRKAIKDRVRMHESFISKYAEKDKPKTYDVRCQLKSFWDKVSSAFDEEFKSFILEEAYALEEVTEGAESPSKKRKLDA